MLWKKLMGGRILGVEGDGAPGIRVRVMVMVTVRVRIRVRVRVRVRVRGVAFWGSRVTEYQVFPETLSLSS